MSLVECVRCRARVPVPDTTFNENGDYLCRRCTDVVDLGQTVERARQEAIANARARGGGGLGGLIRSWFEVRRAKKEHEAFAASLPDVENAPTTCKACGASVPRGYALCDRCRAVRT